jgi:2-methylcitrate dehydratase PrpD
MHSREVPISSRIHSLASASERLAAFVAGLGYDDLPPPVVAKIKLHVLDLLGVALAAVPCDFSAAAVRAGRVLGGSGPCTVIGARDGMPAPWAAMVNGVLAHGLDYDDTHSESVVHVSASVVPATLAVCEDAGASGRTCITALAAAMETDIRVGLVAPGSFHDRGFHPTGVCGAYACAIAAGKVAGLAAGPLADALGLAGSQSAGTMEFLTDGSWAKRLHPGWAAHAGLVAVRLAAAGFSGPRGTFDGRFGLYRTHLGEGEWHLPALTDMLGARWHLLDTALKPYPCCHMNHAFIDCIGALRAGAEWDADEVAQIECFIHPREVPVVCEPHATKQAPQSDYDAKFSLPYAVASMLVRGHVEVDDFEGDAFRDPAVLALARRVVHREDPASDYPRYFPGWVRIRLRDGRVMEHREPINRGSLARPLTGEQVRDKFRRNARRALPPERVETVNSLVSALEEQRNVAALGRALRGENGHAYS